MPTNIFSQSERFVKKREDCPVPGCNGEGSPAGRSKPDVSLAIWLTQQGNRFRQVLGVDRDWQNFGSPTAVDAANFPGGFGWGCTELGLTSRVVQKLLASTTGDHAVDIRDRAILMLLAVYGLRSEKVRGLQLEDLDWDRELINIGRLKPRRIQQ